MKSHMTFAKKDIAVTLGCLIFLLGSLGAIGAGGKRRAKEAVCLSNLRKWGVCFQLYANDNEGYFMEGFIGATLEPENEYKLYWMEALRSYYRNPDLRLCPQATTPGTELGLGEYGVGGGSFSAWGVFSDTWSYSVPGDYGSYGWNGYVANPRPGYGIWGGEDVNWRRANVNGAGNIPLLGDHQFVDCWPQHTNNPPEYDGQSWSNTSQMGRCCINRHSGYVNWAFMDFSARKVGLKELWTLKWNRGYKTDGPWTICGGVQPFDWPEWMRDFEDY